MNTLKCCNIDLTWDEPSQNEEMEESQSGSQNVDQSSSRKSRFFHEHSASVRHKSTSLFKTRLSQKVSDYNSKIQFSDYSRLSAFSKDNIIKSGYSERQKDESFLFESKINRSLFSDSALRSSSLRSSSQNRGRKSRFGTKRGRRMSRSISKPRRSRSKIAMAGPRKVSSKRSKHTSEIEEFLAKIKKTRLRVCEICCRAARLSLVRRCMEKVLLCRYFRHKTLSQYLIPRIWFQQWENYMFLERDSDPQIKKLFFNRMARPGRIENQKAMQKEKKVSQKKKSKFAPLGREIENEGAKIIFNETTYK